MYGLESDRAVEEESTASLWSGLTFGFLFVAIIAALVYIVVILWPSKGKVTGGSYDLFWGWSTWNLTADQQLLVLVAIAGALGGFVNSLTHLATYIGDGNLKWRYCLTYAVQPVAGAAIALIFYIVILAGFVNFDQINDANCYGYLALALLVGLFVDQAMGKLKAVAAAIFTDPSPPIGPAGGAAVPQQEVDTVAAADDSAATKAGEGSARDQ